jgi:hypothetical protein
LEVIDQQIGPRGALVGGDSRQPCH